MREPNADSPLTAAAAPVLHRIAADLAPQSVSAIITSADGVVLQRVAPDMTIMNALDTVQLAPGYSYAEEFVGTNGIGTALETGQPTFIRGGEHYVGTLGRLACAATRYVIRSHETPSASSTSPAGQASPIVVVRPGQ